jgi:hypothetical protein
MNVLTPTHPHHTLLTLYESHVYYDHGGFLARLDFFFYIRLRPATLINSYLTTSQLYWSVGFEVFTAVTMKNAVFWDVAPCRSCEMNRRFGGTRAKSQREQVAAHAGSSLTDFSTLKMEAMRSSETSVHFTGSTRRHIPEDGILHFTGPV